ncbi:MAG: hypothetical protein WCR28_03725 [Candidatus Izemoplasmatales bacterium]|nr:hypothetical protein [Candidatus Izemoplasmatales bacterium]NLF49446.1 hypothetical protein [Acholeplasmataceae bacterium]
MKKLFFLFLMMTLVLALFACDGESSSVTSQTTAQPTSSSISTGSELSESEIYALLVEAEELSGMQSYNGKLISESGDLHLPSSYRGVTIIYSSRNEDVISNDGYVTLPDECWIESREQDGITPKPGLNDNWPIVVDVKLTYGNQERSAKLMFIVVPADGFTCDKYKG